MGSARTIERSDGSRVHVVITDRADGDFHIDADPGGLRSRRASIVGPEWSVVRQVHGSSVVDAASAGPEVEADGIITSEVGRPIAVQGADCAPLAFVASAGPIGVAHVGWRGLMAGIIEAMHSSFVAREAVIEHVIVGPRIGAECYEFSQVDLDLVAARFGDGVRARTAQGSPALDLEAGILEALSREGIDGVQVVGACTACSGSGFSHRANGDARRLALVGWIERRDGPARDER